MPTDQCTGERDDVAGSLTQRSDLQGEDVQTVEEILAEATGLDLRFQIAVGRGEEPEPRRLCACRAERREFALLQHPQQLGLHRERHLADLVEEQRSAISLLEESLEPLHGAGECAFFVSEQQVFDHALRQTRAVERDEGAGAPQRVVVDHPREHFLTGAR